jgi:hypothetical protein
VATITCLFIGTLGLRVRESAEDTMNKSRVASSCSTVRWTDLVVAPEEDVAVAVASHTSSKATKGDMDLIYDISRRKRGHVAQLKTQTVLLCV